jgi:hypothetical protein
MDALAGALGSVVGYLGAEVAEEEIFKKLLWPQRFYNEHTVGSLIQQFLLMGMGGPLHRAALATLNDLRDHGLYLRARRGDMLATAFYKDFAQIQLLENASRQRFSTKRVPQCALDRSTSRHQR